MAKLQHATHIGFANDLSKKMPFTNQTLAVPERVIAGILLSRFMNIRDRYVTSFEVVLLSIVLKSMIWLCHFSVTSKQRIHGITC